MSNRQQGQRVHGLRDKVDFVIIGSGAAGGIMAKELSIAGFSVVVLEQGPYMKPHQFMHDEFGGFEKRGLGARSGGEDDPQTFRESEKEETEIRQSLNYLRMVGGTQTHFTANSWRFHEIDFKERSIYGPVEGTEIEDWPITYEELEPYYTKVDWEFGISGEPGPHDPPRSRHYPMPPLPVKSSGVIFEKAAKKLGWNPYPAPMAILSRPHNGRPSCVHCGFCMGFGCEVSAKSTSLSAMIP
ncbi:MAG: FAD-binding protein, partial [Bacteroidetes bacterium]|nr:FAD-binding protein [Bacteroidota bacterium]